LLFGLAVNNGHKVISISAFLLKNRKKRANEYLNIQPQATSLDIRDIHPQALIKFQQFPLDEQYSRKKRQNGRKKSKRAYFKSKRSKVTS